MKTKIKGRTAATPRQLHPLVRRGMIAGLEYGLEMCKYRKCAPLVNEAFKAGCDDVGVFIAAAKARLEAGGELRDYAVTCAPNKQIAD